MKISLTELLQIIADRTQLATLVQLVSELLTERTALKQQILDLLAADAEQQAKVQAAFEKSEGIEARMRGAVAGTPAA